MAEADENEDGFVDWREFLPALLPLLRSLQVRVCAARCSGLAVHVMLLCPVHLHRRTSAFRNGKALRLLVRWIGIGQGVPYHDDSSLNCNVQQCLVPESLRAAREVAVDEHELLLRPIPRTE